MSGSCNTSHECPSDMLSPHSTVQGECPEPCAPCEALLADSSKWVDSVSSDYPIPTRSVTKKINFAKYKEILKKPSNITGDNMYDHLVEIITRIIDERPVNVVDYFEEYSRDVRANKYRLTDRPFFEPYVEPQFLEIAKSVMRSLKLPYALEELECVDEGEEMYLESMIDEYVISDTSLMPTKRLKSPHDNVILYQHLWSFCGLGFSVDEAFQLAWTVQKIQTMQIVQTARFWGKIYGTHGSYYVVEAVLTKAEIHQRFAVAESRLMSRMIGFIHRRDNPKVPDEDPDLVPGAYWQNYPIQTLQRMQPAALPVPVLITEEKFDMPSEPIGAGLNRKVYFVTTHLGKEWTELPPVTPKQIQISRKIRKHFTGHLDARLHCYPLFPGTEKNYLRAMIARITAASYIAPYGFYRKLNKRELIDCGEIEGDNEEEEEEGLVEEEEDMDNDTPITEDVTYSPLPLATLGNPCAWVHYRPHILKQGRVHYIDEEIAFRELERDAMEKIRKKMGKHGPEGDDGDEEEKGSEEGDEEGEEEELLDEEIRPDPEVGPELFTLAGEDVNCESVKPWSGRLSAHYNKTNQMVIMRSNLWPGAYNFTFENYADSIYMGWGLKYVARTMCIQQVPPTQDYDYPDVMFEATDPTPEMEEKWRLYHMKRELLAMEEMSISVDFDVDDVEDDR